MYFYLPKKLAPRNVAGVLFSIFLPGIVLIASLNIICSAQEMGRLPHIRLFSLQSTRSSSEAIHVKWKMWILPMHNEETYFIWIKHKGNCDLQHEKNVSSFSPIWITSNIFIHISVDRKLWYSQMECCASWHYTMGNNFAK